MINEWQPIETAPTRKLILMFSQPFGYNRLGEYCVGYVNKEFVGNPDYKYTHWMYLPEPPKEVDESI